MALAWPSSGIPNPEVFRISPRENVVGDASPFTGSREVMHRWHQWHVYMQWNHVTNEDFWGLFGHFNNSQGGRILFQIPIFSYRGKLGTKAGSVTLSGAHSASATSLTITGGTGQFARGDWIDSNQVATVPRAYVVTAAESGGVIQINPGLRKNLANGSVIHHFATGQILDTMELADPEFALSMPSPTPGFFQPFSLELVSAIRINP